MTLHTRCIAAGKEPVATNKIRLTAIALALATMASCASVKMQRRAGTYKYASLPVGTPVKVLPLDTLPTGKFVVLGVLESTVHSRHKAPKSTDAQKKFQKFAAKFGCDVITGQQVTTKEVKTLKKVKVRDANGKVTWHKEHVVSWDHKFTVRCVRTDQAPGGLRDAPSETSTAKSTAKPPTLVATDTSTAQPPVATAAGVQADDLWEQLGRYKSTFLKNWSDALQGPPKDALVVLEAFSELMVQVTGPTGFWRQTVRFKWLGCKQAGADPACLKMVKALPHLRQWHRLQPAVARQRESTAKNFLTLQHKRLRQYLDNVVPERPSMTGMEKTPFYAKHLK